MRTLLVAPVLAGALVLAGCGSDSSTTGGETDADTSALPASADTVVATTTILGDVVGRIADCVGAPSVALMPIGVDPHDFSPSSAQVAALLDAPLVVANGLGLEEGLADALTSAEADGARVLEVAEQVDPLPFTGDTAHGHDEEHADEEHADGGLDPHFWHDVSRMATAAELIGTDLAEATGESSWAECGASVADELRTLDDEVRAILDTVPADRRVLVTDHDAFGYFADAYDFEVAGVVIPGGATLAEPSSGELATLVDVIKDESVPAIFSNTAAPTSLTDAVAAEAGSEVTVVPLYVGSLGPAGSGAESYAGMMTTNAQLIADALGTS
jgi:zinc/manganese transport system substrate-binding protein